MSLSPAIAAAMISGGCTVTGTVTAVVLAAWLQTRRIDTQNRAALEKQTEQIKKHIEASGTAVPAEGRSDDV